MIFKKIKNEYSRLDKVGRIEFVISHIFRFLMLIAIAGELYSQNWLFLFLTIFALALSFAPAAMEKEYNITLPTEFEFALVLFIFSAIFLGEVQDFYIRFAWWDTMLHSIAGILLGLIGFSIVYILYSRKRINVSPLFVAVFTFCFAMALGTIWEIFEFAMDHYVGTNMQRARFTIEEVAQYGSTRIALLDTMKDLIIDAIGAGIVAISGYFYVKNGDSLLIKTLLKRIYSSSSDNSKEKREKNDSENINKDLNK